MYSVPPGEMRILDSREEIDLFFPFMDPVVVKQKSNRFGTELRRQQLGVQLEKKKAGSECFAIIEEATIGVSNADPQLNPVEIWENCKEATLWGLPLEEYLVREALSRKICLEGVLDRSDFGVPLGLNAR